MKTRLNFTRYSQLCAALFLAIAIGGARQAGAAASSLTDTWSGGSGTGNNWSDTANWVGGVAPSTSAYANDFLAFTNTTRLSPNNDLTGTPIFGNIVFASPAGAFTLGGNALILTNTADVGDGVAQFGSISNQSANIETISLPLTFSPGNHYVATAAAGALNISGTVTRNKGAFLQFTKNSGNINLTGSGITTNGNNNILGGWAVIGLAANAGDWASLDNSGNVVPLANYVTVASIANTTIASNNNANIKITGTVAGTYGLLTAPGAPSAGATTKLNTIIYNTSAAGTINVGAGTNLILGQFGGIMNDDGGQGIKAGGTYNSANVVLTIGPTFATAPAGAGTMTAGTTAAGGEITLIDNSIFGGQNDLQIYPSITDNGAGGAVSLNIEGYVVLQNTNTYSGGTYINQGRVNGNTSTHALGTGPVYVFPGGHLQSVTCTNSVFLAGTGFNESGNAGFGAVRSGTLSGPVVLTGNVGIGGGVTIMGPISGNGSLIVGVGKTGSGAGVETVGSGAGPNTYSGDTVINFATNIDYTPTAGNTLKMALGTNNIMPNGSGKGNVVMNAFSATVTATFDLDGTAQTINGLFSTATSPANNFVNSSVAGAVLTIGAGDAGGNFAGSIQNGAGSLALTKIGNGTQVLSGVNTYTGGTTVGGGTLALVGSGSLSASSAIAVSNATLDVAGLSGNYTVASALGMTNATLNLGANKATALSSFGISNTIVSFPLNPGGVAITTTTFATGGATNTLAIVSVPGLPVYPTNITVIKYTTADANIVDVNNALTTLGVSLPVLGSPVGYLTNNVANSSIDLVLTSGPLPVVPITWIGSVSGNWDILTTANWVTTSDGVTSYQYQDTSDVRFDDNATNFSVNVTTTVAPATLVVSNTANDYAFSGSGKLSGPYALNKLNGGKLTLGETGGDNYTGGISANGGTVVIDNNSSAVTGGTTIASGATVQVGNNDTKGTLPAGGVTDNGTLVLSRTDSNTVANVISGSGAVTQNSGINKLAAANTYSGATLISGGTVVLGNSGVANSGNGGLGAIPGGAVTVTNGGTLDVGGGSANQTITFTNLAGQAKQFFIAGTGAGGNGVIVNNGSAVQQNAFQYITLTANATVGGPTRWDMRGVGTIIPILDLNGHTLTKEGVNQMSLVGVIVTNNGNIVINNGILSFETASTFTNSVINITVNPGGALGQFRNVAGTFTAPITLNGGAIRDLNGTPAATNDAPITLTADSFLDCNPGSTSVTKLNGVISSSGSFSLTKTNANFYFLSGVNTYSGNTMIMGGGIMLTNSGSLASATIGINSNSTFSVAGLTSQPYSIVSGQTLKALNIGGAANVVGGVTLDSGALLAENYGGSIVPLNISGGTLTLNNNATTVTVSGPALVPGAYKIISKGTGGSVGGSVAASSLTVNGSGYAANSAAFLQITSGELFLMVNQTPTIANIVTNAVNATLTWKIAIPTLASAAGWHDAESDPLTLTAVGPTSTLGKSVTSDGSFVYYNAPVLGDDSFTYTITDGHSTANGTVVIKLANNTSPTFNMTATVTNIDNSITLAGASIPGRTNIVQRTTDLTPPISWTPIATNVIGTNGLWQVTDPSPSSPSYYRAVTQP